MSAEILRRAAVLMREEATDSSCSCGMPDCDNNDYPAFLTAVADWLDAPGCSCPPCACCGVPQCDEACEPREGALNVARAYLGESG